MRQKSEHDRSVYHHFNIDDHYHDHYNILILIGDNHKCCQHDHLENPKHDPLNN